MWFLDLRTNSHFIRFNISCYTDSATVLPVFAMFSYIRILQTLY
jgi:hypothetical protein